MSGRLAALVVVIIAFAVLTGIALVEVGYAGIFGVLYINWGGTQVFVDLIIALTLFLIWMWRDAREQEISIWPFVLITLTLGSFGPLCYLALREWRGRQASPVSV